MSPKPDTIEPTSRGPTVFIVVPPEIGAYKVSPSAELIFPLICV